MKKFIYSLIIYIGLCIEVFNPHNSYAQINIPLPFTEELSAEINLNKNKPIIEADNEFLKLVAVFFIIDKLYPDEQINENISEFLHQVWPKTKIEKLEKISQYFKKLIILKRKYVYVIDSLKQKIKASNTLIEDAPVIAKDGEYAPKISDKRKDEDSTDYKVSYTPYKYLAYDKGEYGEAVRRRDKNYEPASSSAIDELTLALLQFNIKAFYKALQKLPNDNDGSREKLVELGGNIRSRIVMDTMALGNKETIRGFMEVYVPQNLYINGDYLNTKVKPQFIIDESGKTDTNIKDYQLYYPKAIGVENNNEASRILVGSVRFPLEIKRRDLNKDVNIKGTFTFNVCQARTKNCKLITSHNSLTLNTSVDTMSSMHTNAVQLAFANLPNEKTRHASLKEATYNPQTKTLTVKFKTNKKFSNVAAMAEDAAETNFLNPQYKIEKDEVTASFQTKLENKIDSDTQINIENGGEIAVTAAFDEYDVLRAVITPDMTNSLLPPTKHTSPYRTAFQFGLLLSFMPGIFYLLQSLLSLFIDHPKHRSIFIRYIFGTAIGFSLLAIYNRTHIWSQIYENSWVILTAVLFAASYTMHSFNYMDFNFFRPLRGKIKRGCMIGLVSVLFIAAAPLPYKKELFNQMIDLPTDKYMYCWFIIGLSFIFIPFLCYIYRNKLISTAIKMHYFNRAYTIIYLMLIALTGIYIYKISAIIIFCSAALLLIFLWYVYPKAIAAAIKHKRSQKGKEEVFDKVQTHAAVATMIIWLFAGILLNIIPIKNQPVPDIQTIEEEADTLIKKDNSLLFVLNAPWSPTSWLNQIYLQKLKEKNITIIQYTPTTTNKNALMWYNKYQNHTPPLHILYTARHPNGLYLPSNLTDINWSEATADFIEKTKEEE